MCSSCLRSESTTRRSHFPQLGFSLLGLFPGRDQPVKDAGGVAIVIGVDGPTAAAAGSLGIKSSAACENAKTSR